MINNRNQVQMLVNGFMSTAIIYTACELNLFDVIKKQSGTLDTLAKELKVDIEYLTKIVRPLVQYKLLKCVAGMYTVTDMGMFLVEDTERSLKDYTLFCGRECINVWMKMYESMLEDRPAFEILGEERLFDHLENDQRRFSTFNKMMSLVSQNLDLEGVFKKLENKYASIMVVDVGGGTGTIMRKFLTYYPQAKGTILDLNQAKEAAIQSLCDHGFSNRCVFKEANFFEPIQTRGDIFVLSRVLHDWDDEQAELILKNVVSAMSDESRVVIIDEIILDPDNPLALKGYICDIQMWVFCNGKERTKNEFENLFDKAGLALCACTNIDQGTSAFICTKKNKTNYEMGEI